MSAYVKNPERSQINSQMLLLKVLKKQEQSRPKTSRRKEIIKIRTQINEMERIKEIKSCFFDKIKKIDKPVANLTKMRSKKTQINKMWNKKGRDNKCKGNPQKLPGLL
jgi:hypothetical protein